MISSLHFHGTPYDIITMGRVGSNTVPEIPYHLTGVTYFHCRSMLIKAMKETPL